MIKVTLDENGKKPRLPTSSALPATAPAPPPVVTAPSPVDAPKALTGPAGLKADGTWSPQSESVADRVNQLTAEDSPLMQQARGMGMKTAASRGLLNSTMAGRSGEAAAIAAATPIASQDAAQTAAKNDLLISGKTQRDIATQNAATERELQQVRGQQSMELQGLTGQQQRDLATQNAGAEKEIAQLNVTANRDLQTLKGDQDLKTAQLQASTQLQSQAAASAAAMLNSYNDAVAQIGQNTKLDATSRSNYLTSLNNSTQAGIELINQATGATLQWGSGKPTTSGTPAPGAMLGLQPGGFGFSRT